MQIVTWPFKKFVGYVCGKLLAGYLESELDFEKLGYKDGALSVKDIVLNPSKLNENLKDVPYKIMSATIQSLKVAVPRHFLTESIKITLSDIDVLIMPIGNVKKESAANNPIHLVPKPEPKPNASTMNAEPPPPSDETPDTSAQIPQDEDGLTKAINGVLANLECEINNVSIRVLTAEFHPEEGGIDIPTFLLRFTHIEYKNTSATSPSKTISPGKQKLLKTIQIGQYALFLMNKHMLSREEFGKDPLVGKLVFPFSYPPICHPSAILVSETNTAMAAKILLELDLEKHKYSVSVSMNNIDILLSPLQIYTLTHMVNYTTFLFDSFARNMNSDQPDQLSVPISNPNPNPNPSPSPSPSPNPNPNPIPPQPTRKPSSPLADFQVEVHFELFRVTARILLEDNNNFKRYYHSYKSEDLGIEGQIHAIQWKIPYNFFELLVVNTRCDVTIGSKAETEVSGKIRYLLLSSNILQSFGLNKTGQILDESVSTIYQSAHRAFSVINPEVPNFLAEDTSINQSRFHFCLQKIVEIKSPNSSVSFYSQTEEWEMAIDSYLSPLRERDNSSEAISFILKIGVKEGRINRDVHLSIFEKDVKPSNTNNTINLISLDLAIAGIVLEFSPDIPLFIDNILNPTGGIVLQFTQYNHIISLYNVENCSSSMGAVVAAVEEIRSTLKMPEIVSNSVSAEKNWILNNLSIKVPFIRTKVWLLHTKRNLLLEFYKEKNVDTAKLLLEKLKNPSSVKGSQYYRDSPFAMIQLCRCMNICRLSDILAGRLGKDAVTNPIHQQLYYRNEIIVMDIVNISATAREIHESSKISGRLFIQALLADVKVDSANLYGNINGKIKQLAKVEFLTTPYSVRFVIRDKITHTNKLLVDAELSGDTVKIEYSAKSKHEDKEGSDIARQFEFGIIETPGAKNNNVNVDFQVDEENKYNPFLKTSSEFSDRETHVKQSAKTYMKINVKSISLVFDIEAIGIFIEYFETIDDNVLKLQYILENKERLIREIESCIKRNIVKKEQKKEIKTTEIAKDKEPEMTKQKSADKEGVDITSELVLAREESKMTTGIRSESSDSSEYPEEEKKSGESEDVEQDQVTLLSFVLNLSISDISAYLTETASLSETSKGAKEDSFQALDKESKIDDILLKHSSITGGVVQPILILKLNKIQGLVYKMNERDTQIKTQILNAVLVDNTISPVPLYSSSFNIEEVKEPKFSKYYSEKLIDVYESLDYFITNYPSNIVLYKEEGVKEAPIISFSLKLANKDLSGGVNESDIENECTIDIGLNGVVIRPELHTAVLTKLIQALVNFAAQNAPPSKMKKELDLGNEKSPTAARKSPAQSPAKDPMQNQLLKFNISIRNLTIDIWPTLQLSSLVEIDAPVLGIGPNVNKEKRWRSRQRTLVLLDRLQFKMVSAPFISQDKIEAYLEDARIVTLNCANDSHILLKDKESLLNSTLSLVHKLGFCDIATIEKIEAHFRSQLSPEEEGKAGEEEKKYGEFGACKKVPTQRLDISATTIGISACYDSLITAIRSANCILTGVGDLQINLNTIKPPEIEGEIKDPIISEEKVQEEVKSYETKRQARREELKLSKEMHTEDFVDMFEIVNQGTKKMEKSSMRKEERINAEAMKEAFALMDANPDYMSKASPPSVKVKAEDKIEGDVIIKTDEEGNTTITREIEYVPDHISQPKSVAHQYEIEYHALPKDYPKPKLTVHLSVNKVALLLCDGSDFDNIVEPIDSFEIITNRKGSDGKKARKIDTFVEISLQNIGLALYQFPEKNLRMLRATLSIEDLNCIESLSQAFPAQMIEIIHHETAEHIAKASVDILNQAQDQKADEQLPELVLKVKAEPIQLMLHQKVLEFLREFATRCQQELIEKTKEESKESDKKPEEKKPEEKKQIAAQRDIFVQKVTISQFYVKFNYRSYKLSMSKLVHKELFELLNITDIRDLLITFKKFEGRGFNTIEEMSKAISQHYTTDIVDNQLLTCVTAVSPIRTVTNIVEGFVDIFRLPIQSYKKRKRLWSGFTEGIGSFASKVATETKLIGQTLMGFVIKRLTGEN